MVAPEPQLFKPAQQYSPLQSWLVVQDLPHLPAASTQSFPQRTVPPFLLLPPLFGLGLQAGGGGGFPPPPPPEQGVKSLKQLSPPQSAFEEQDLPHPELAAPQEEPQRTVPPPPPDGGVGGFHVGGGGLVGGFQVGGGGLFGGLGGGFPQPPPVMRISAQFQNLSPITVSRVLPPLVALLVLW